MNLNINLNFTIMKRVLSFLFVAVLIVFTACQKEEIEEAPGNIPGMGEAAGDLQVEQFELPSGIELVGVEGADGYNETTTSSSVVWNEGALKSLNNTARNQSLFCYGSGGIFVRVKLQLKNTSLTDKRTVFFPRGLLFKVLNIKEQHGILLQWTWVCFGPQETRTVFLDLYCLNKGRNGSNINSNYEILGIAKSEIMWKLLRRIGWRKINFEHFKNNRTLANLKSSENEEVSYETVASKLQEAVWAVTNGTGLTEEQLEFIESLPQLESDKYPEGLDDKTIEPPYYFDEYTPVE